MLYLHKTLTKKIMLFIINNKSDEKDDTATNTSTKSSPELKSDKDKNDDNHRPLVY